MDYSDFKSFKNKGPVFLEWVQTFEVNSGKIHLSDRFLQLFPKLSELVFKARVLDIDIDGVKHKLYSWESLNLENIGGTKEA